MGVSNEHQHLVRHISAPPGLGPLPDQGKGICSSRLGFSPTGENLFLIFKKVDIPASRKYKRPMTLLWGDRREVIEESTMIDI